MTQSSMRGGSSSGRHRAKGVGADAVRRHEPVTGPGRRVLHRARKQRRRRVDVGAERAVAIGAGCSLEADGPAGREQEGDGQRRRRDGDHRHPLRDGDSVPLEHEPRDAVPPERDHERDDGHAVRREARAEEHRRDRRLEPSIPVAKRADPDDEAADRDHPAHVLGRVHVEVAAQLVVEERQGEEWQERRQQAQAELPPERPQPGREAGRRDPQERAHGGERRSRRAGTTSPAWKLFRTSFEIAGV